MRTPRHDYALCDNSNVGHLATHSPVIEDFGHIWWHADTAAYTRLGETRLVNLDDRRHGVTILTPTKFESFSSKMTWWPTRRNATAHARPAAPPPTIINLIGRAAFLADAWLV